jgi:hypothetical protein
VINKRLAEGIKLPIGAGIRSTSVPGDKKVHINKDMIILEVGEVSIAPILKTSKFEQWQALVHDYPNQQEIGNAK